jgi:transcriptional regulator with XRE-family HTH domain
MTPAQCRAARALLDITQPQLASRAGVGLSTVVDFERERRPVSQEAIARMQDALERAGIGFGKAGIEMAFQPRFEEQATLFKGRHVGEMIPGGSLLTSAQIRAGRALLRWTVADLAGETALGVNTIRRAELSDERLALTAANERAIRRALETAGVVFIDENGGGPGVRLRNRQNPKARGG